MKMARKIGGRYENNLSGNTSNIVNFDKKLTTITLDFSRNS
jgi:hypothetical protein